MESMSFFARLWLAFILPWKLLFDGAFAARVQRLLRGQAEAPPPAVAAPTPPPVREAHDAVSALQLLSIMQREGRFIDFLQEDVAQFSDAEIGAAARVVHEGCKRGLAEYLILEPVRSEEEGAPVVLERGFDASRTRVTGNVVGEPPLRGRLAHHGWQVKQIQLPTLAVGHDPKVVAPAEVEL